MSALLTCLTTAISGTRSLEINSFNIDKINDTLEAVVWSGMKKVLVAVDGSDKSLEAADYAMSIANKEGAQLIILNVLDTEPWFYGQSAYGWATEDELS